MKISIIGTGYVGLTTGIGFALKGHKVQCIDLCKEKVNAINAKKSPVFEQGFNEALQKIVPKNLTASTDLKKSVMNSDISFVCVGTPCNEKSEMDFSFIESACKELAVALKEKNVFHLIVIKSTVLPETIDKKIVSLMQEFSGKKIPADFSIACNPEFLREGIALHDFLNPDRIVLGTKDEKSLKLLKELYADFNAPIVETSCCAAEMIKYASNAFLASKISFANELGNLCKKVNVNVDEVINGMSLDKRINAAFLSAGIGFGGSCFPKDVQAIIKKGEAVGEGMHLLKAVLKVNELQPLKLIELAKKRISLKGKNVSVLGLAFKPETDDVRESRTISLIQALLNEGAKVNACDPVAEKNFKKIFPKLSYFDSPQKAVNESEIVFLAAGWKEFESLDFSNKMVFDGRANSRKLKSKPKNYEGICW